MEFHRLLAVLIFDFGISGTKAQEYVTRFATNVFHSHQRIFLAGQEGWIFQQSHDPSLNHPNVEVAPRKELAPILYHPNQR